MVVGCARNHAVQVHVETKRNENHERRKKTSGINSGNGKGMGSGCLPVANKGSRGVEQREKEERLEARKENKPEQNRAFTGVRRKKRK